MLPAFPHTKDSRVVLRTYAWIAGAGGVVTTLFGASWIEPDLPGMPFGMAALVRVFGAAFIASALWASFLSKTGDPELRRNGVGLFLAAHFIVFMILDLQCMAVWPPVISSKINDFIGPWTAALLLIVILNESYFSGRVNAAADGAQEAVRTQYERQIRQAGAQEERNRLARDLHDSIKQQIFVIQTAAATTQARFDNDRAGAAAALDQIRDSARDAMTEMEVMMDQLRSVPLENTGLVEALKKQCEALGHRTGAKVDFTVGTLPPNETLGPGAHRTILRVAQEAGANIGRHARADKVTVSLDTVDGQLELRIQDDGAGFQSSPGQAGMGIPNMRARAKESGGRFSLTSNPGAGTTVVFSVPPAKPAPAGHDLEYIQEGLLFLLISSSIILFVPRGQRPFAFAAWAIAGLTRIVQLRRALLRERESKQQI